MWVVRGREWRRAVWRSRLNWGSKGGLWKVHRKLRLFLTLNKSYIWMLWALVGISLLYYKFGICKNSYLLTSMKNGLVDVFVWKGALLCDPGQLNSSQRWWSICRAPWTRACPALQLLLFWKWGQWHFLKLSHFLLQKFPRSCKELLFRQLKLTMVPPSHFHPCQHFLPPSPCVRPEKLCTSQL